jgi:hypothetical protein
MAAAGADKSATGALEFVGHGPGSLPGSGVMTVSRGRIGLARALAAVSAVWWGFFFFGLIDLMTVVVQDARFYEHYLLETGWGLLYLVLVAVPFAVLAVRPRVGLPVLQVLLVTLAMVGGAVLATYPRQLLAALALGLTVFAVLWAAGSRPVVRDRRPDVPLAGLTALVVPAGLGYAWSQAHGWRGLPPEITNGLDHSPMQAALGLAVPLVAALGAVGLGTGHSGWRVPVWTVAVTVLWLGAVSMVYPVTRAASGPSWASARCCGAPRSWWLPRRGRAGDVRRPPSASRSRRRIDVQMGGRDER